MGNIFIYIIIFVGFLLVAKFLQKFNQGQVDATVATAKAENPLPRLAAFLGLQYEDISQEKEKGTFYNVGSRVSGVYAGLPVELVFASQAADAKTFVPGYTYSYQKTLTFTVKNENKKSFNILPRIGGMSAVATGNPTFDEKLTLTGDNILPGDTLDMFGKLGWMNLMLKGDKLVFNDTFYEQFHGLSGSMAMMSAVHPVWGTTIQNNNFDLDRAKLFFDTLVDLAKRAKLV